MALESPIAYWNGLATAADDGQLFLDPAAARHCDKACTEYLSTLETNKDLAFKLGNVKGMGTFESGIALARKFSQKAVGGPNNLVDVLQSHIDVVTAMQAVFRKFFVTAEDVDEHNATSIGQHGPR
ncbi:hypothetical protein O1W68_19695 [Rhodococcus sp. H36-A4]|uniref:hypothetical protein n=1 Tax=Rhodococcus sp. H36-A4 TaxID=3004353 RepID=UPI0022AEF89F|nr:hypothetical protein [Rhodococcus sp. H36-A4]MCZ4080173.1 hypothetical protein [Rhodococcus sp. H36-A4]